MLTNIQRGVNVPPYQSQSLRKKFVTWLPVTRVAQPVCTTPKDTASAEGAMAGDLSGAILIRSSSEQRITS
jgi:hypothetical protein